MIKQSLVLLLFLGLFTACQSEAPKTTATDEAEKTAQTAETKEEKTEAAPSQRYELGDAVADFKLKNVDGKMVSMADYPEAKGFVVIFTCNHCPFSIAYEDRIIALDKKYKELGYPVIAINPNDPEVNADDSYPKMQERAKEKGFSFPYLFDEGQNVFPLFGATKTPHCFLLNKEGDALKLVYKGAFDDSKEAEEVSKTFLADALDALLKNEAPSPNSTLAFGCSIKTNDESKIAE